MDLRSQRVPLFPYFCSPVGDREVNNVDDWQEEVAGEIFEVKIILLWVVYERPVGGADHH